MVFRMKNGVFSWALYDFASSTFSSIITTFIFATYFTKSIAINTVVGTTQWGEALTVAGIMIAIASPIFGSIADYSGPRKPWLAFFTGLCIIGCFLLWFAAPQPSFTLYALICFVIATIGFEVATVFYNSMMYDLVPDKYLGRLSGWAWSLGYAGGLIALAIMLLIINTKGSWLGLNDITAEHIRISGPFVACWFLLFSLPLFFFTKDKPKTNYQTTRAIKQGFAVLITTLKNTRKNKEIFKFLLARMLYIDGLNTLFAFGGIYAAGTFGMNFDEVVLFGIAMNVSAGLGALIFAWLDDFKGSKLTILLSILGLLITGISLLVIHDKLLFWIIALTLGLFVGPTQAASRSFMTRLAPKEKLTEMFGLYAFSGKITSFLGPFLLSITTAYFASQRAGMSTVMILLIAGGALLLSVKQPHHHSQL